MNQKIYDDVLSLRLPPSHIATQHQPTGPCAGDQSWQRLLSTARHLGRRSETYAQERLAAHGVALRGLPNAARSARGGRLQSWTTARCNADEAYGDQGIVSEAQNLKTGSPGTKSTVMSPSVVKKLGFITAFAGLCRVGQVASGQPDKGSMAQRGDGFQCHIAASLNRLFIVLF